jgi:murein DD-endopeptidase MepM/ murein hydrolase activator NlpD
MMGNKHTTYFRYYLFVIAALVVLSISSAFVAAAAQPSFKLPFEKGERFIVAQGYNTPPTHINKDFYALDFTQNGCSAYGKKAFAATSGKVMLAQGSGYNGGYGSQVLVTSSDASVVSRYAHLIPGSVTVGNGDWVAQGEPLGEIGDTGLVAGFACGAHPGTHLHFAVYREASNGSFTSELAEPISGYSHLEEGKWYLSDNEIALASVPGLAAVVEKTVGKVLGVEVSQPSIPRVDEGAVTIITPPLLPAGGVSASPAVLVMPAITNEPTIATTLPALSPVSTTIQSVDDQVSLGSWYSGNWYQLGTGFYGLVNAITLEGYIDTPHYGSSSVWLDEFLDARYQNFNQRFVISTSAPFTDQRQKVTFDGLHIPFQPNKFYRLETNQQSQNHSVILAGTTATGTAMWSQFLPGTGGVENRYTFYPYLSMTMISNYPPLARPDPPANMTTTFDTLNARLYVSWSVATDSDTTSSLLTYEVQITTSTALDDSQWTAMGANLSTDALVAYKNDYMIGVRATDDFGATSTPLVMPWHFPVGYAPLPQQTDHSHESSRIPHEITFEGNAVVIGIHLWTNPHPDGVSCCSQSYLTLSQDSSGTMGDVIATSKPVTINQYMGEGDRYYEFVSSTAISPGSYWLAVYSGPAPSTNGFSVYGSTSDWYYRVEQTISP